MSRIHEALLQAQEQTQEDQKLASSIALEPSGPALDGGGLTLEMIQVNAGRIREWQSGDPFGLGDDPGKRQIVSEQFRSMRSRIYRASETRELHKVLVTSAVPGEGKTFVSMNLAQILSQVKNHRVVLVDGDLRCSRLDKCLGSPTPGLADYLGGKADELSIVRQGPQENLYVISAGSYTEAPAELIATPRFELLLKKLRGVFDWIIIDSPPVIPVSDAAVMAAHCDGVVLVVKADSTGHALAQQACRELQKRPLLGVVLNHAPFSKHRYGKYYSGYGYGYGRGSEQPKSGLNTGD
jgi:capsular exopolysaccharide synthesis family protein